jgi:Fe-S oxidoreductase
VLFDSFVAGHLERGELAGATGDALVHVHCHQRALVGTDDTGRALSAAGWKVRLLDAGCCGMAGAFGYDKAHYAVSVHAGERVLLPAVRNADAATAIVANGFSCREQIDQLTGRRADHLAEVLGRLVDVSGSRRPAKTLERAG